MLYLKSFFRKKSTKIYLIIYSVLLTTIFSMLVLINYCNKIINDVYKEKSYMLMTTRGDYLEEISKLDGVEKIERIIIFEENESDMTLKNYSFSVVGEDTTINYDNDENGEEIVCWEDYGPASFNDAVKIIIKYDKDDLLGLEENEIALSLEGVKFKNQNTKDNLKGKNILFKYNENDIEFRIKDYYDSNDLEMMISENKFNELNSKSNIYSYKIYVKDYLNTKGIKEKMRMVSNCNDIEIDTRIDYDANKNAEKVSLSLDLWQMFSIITFFSICGLIIIFIIITGNILSDEKKNSKIERVLGYNKKQLKLHVVVKLISLMITALLISLIISFILRLIMS